MEPVICQLAHMSEERVARAVNVKPERTPGNWESWLFGWGPVVLGSVLTVIEVLGPTRQSGQFTGILGFLPCCVISNLLHETGHFFAGLLLRLNPRLVEIGSGRVIFDKCFEHFRLIVRGLPYGGVVHMGEAFSRTGGPWWKRCLTLLAGPLVNGLLFSLSWAVVFGDGQWPQKIQDRLHSIPAQMLLVNGLMLLGNLWPYATRVDGHPVSSDGLRILRIILTRLGFKQAPRPELAVPGWMWLTRNVDSRTFLSGLQDRLNEPNLQAGQRTYLLDAFATGVLMYGATAFLAEADKYSAELLQAKPCEWTVKGTRGSALVELGEVDLGSAMLKEVMEHAPNPFDRAISASFLALAELKRNDTDSALSWLRISRDLDPEGVTMRRIEALATQGTTVKGG